MRFSIRDLMWMTLVVALSLGWWFSHQAIDAQRTAAARQAHRFWKGFSDAKRLFDWGQGQSKDDSWMINTVTPPHVDWSVLNEPLVIP
jgi:hypothetical protein